MTGPFLYLTACSLKNRVQRRLRRLREPRYLAGLVVGLMYLYWFVVRNQLRAPRRAGQFGPAAIDSIAPDVVAGASLLSWGAALLVWLWPFVSKPWSFSGAEVQFFFAGPVTRRRILDYKLLRAQLGLLFGVLVTSIFTGAVRASAAGRLSFAVGVWLLLTAAHLHSIGVKLTKAAIRQRAPGVPWAAWLASASMLGVSGAVLVSYAVRSPELLSAAHSDVLRTVVEVSRTGVAAVALWPFAAVVAPVFARTWAALGLALVPAAIVVAASYWWVLAADAATKGATRDAGDAEASPRGGADGIVFRRAPFDLQPSGRPETAVVWKNSIEMGRYVSAATVIQWLVPVVVLAGIVGLSPRARSFAPVFLLLASFVTMIGPYIVRNDLRTDMPRLLVLKTWPIRGHELLAGELLTPTLVLSAVTWFLLAVAFALAPWWAGGPGTARDRVAVAASMVVVAPALIAGQLIVQNATVVLFPGWIATGRARPRGIEAMGQNMLMFAATLLALAVGVLPAAAVSGGVGFLLYALVGWPGLVPAAVLMAGILGCEVVLVVRWLGRVLERTEPSQVDAAE